MPLSVRSSQASPVGDGGAGAARTAGPGATGSAVSAAGVWACGGTAAALAPGTAVPAVLTGQVGSGAARPGAGGLAAIAGLGVARRGPGGTAQGSSLSGLAAGSQGGLPDTGAGLL